MPVTQSSLTERIRDANPIDRVVREYIRLKRAGQDYLGLCPFHTEKTPSFHVRPERGVFKCFGCGEGGDAFTFIQKINNVNFTEARRILAERAGIVIDEPAVKIDPRKRQAAGQIADECAWWLRGLRAKLMKRELVWLRSLRDADTALTVLRKNGFTDGFVWELMWRQMARSYRRAQRFRQIVERIDSATAEEKITAYLRRRAVVRPEYEADHAVNEMIRTVFK